MRLDIADRFIRLPRLARVLLTCSALMTLAVLHFAHLDEAQRALDETSFVRAAEVLYVPDRRVSRLLTLGYDQAAADLLWLRTLDYFAHHFTTDRRYEWLEHFINQILVLDPRFRKVYHWAGANVLYGRTFTNENVRLSNRFYELALVRFPDDYEAAYRLGLNYYVELRSEDPEEARRNKEKGLSYLEMAANMPGAPHRMRNLVASISRRLGKTQLAIQYILDLLVQETDPLARAGLKTRIARLQASNDAGDLAEAAHAFSGAHKQTFPYASDLLFIHLGEPADRRWQDVSWRTLLPDIAVEGDPRP